MWKKNDDLSIYGIEYTAQTKPIPLDDKTVDCQVYNIPLDKLRYNSKNGRIFMEVNSLKTTNGIDLKSMEQNDVEEFNKEFETLIWDSEPEKNQDTLENIEKYGQLEIGVVLSDGVVIDGNRRFTCLRKLHEKHPDDIRFKYFKAAILFTEDDSISQKAIKKYEFQVQFGRDRAVDYKAVNFAMSIYQEVKSNEFTIPEIAEDVNKKPSDINKIVKTCELIEEFLKYIHQEDQLFIAEELKIYFPFEPLGSYIKDAEAKLSVTDILERKHMFFDFIIAMDVALPTQEFRDNLIKKIFKSDKHFTNLNNQYKNKYKKSVFDSLINVTCTPEEYVTKVHDFKTTTDSDEIKTIYKDEVKAYDMEKRVDQPIQLCKELIEILKNIDLTSFLNATSPVADNKLREIKNYLDDGASRIEDLDQKIIKKLGLADE